MVKECNINVTTDITIKLLRNNYFVIQQSNAMQAYDINREKKVSNVITWRYQGRAHLLNGVRGPLRLEGKSRPWWLITRPLPPPVCRPGRNHSTALHVTDVIKTWHHPNWTNWREILEPIDCFTTSRLCTTNPINDDNKVRTQTSPTPRVVLSSSHNLKGAHMKLSCRIVAGRSPMACHCKD